MSVMYEIRVNGLLGPMLRAAFADLHCRALARHSTIQGRLTAAELRALMTRLNGYGIELVGVRCSDEDPAITSPDEAGEVDPADVGR
jgi:hypothetical protein